MRTQLIFMLRFLSSRSAEHDLSNTEMDQGIIFFSLFIFYSSSI